MVILVKEKSRPGLRAGYVTTLEERLNKLENEVQMLKANRCPHAPILEDHAEQSPTSSLEANHETSQTPGSRSPPDAQTDTPPFDPLSPHALDELCTRWFEDYHPWFPILHQPSLIEALQTTPQLSHSPYHPVLLAIITVTLEHNPPSPSLPRSHLADLTSTYRTQVLTHALSTLSLRSLQALLILSIHDLGAGRLKSHWNLLALAKRMALQLGLRDLVAHHCANFDRVSPLPPRMLVVPASLVEREEKIRAYWMSEVLDCASTLGAAWNVGIVPPQGTGLLPCAEAAWAFPEAVISAWPWGGGAVAEDGFALYVLCAAGEMYRVHLFLQGAWAGGESGAQQRREACVQVDEGLEAWRERFEGLQGEGEGRVDRWDPNVTLVRCALDG